MYDVGKVLYFFFIGGMKKVLSYKAMGLNVRSICALLQKEIQ